MTSDEEGNVDDGHPSSLLSSRLAHCCERHASHWTTLGLDGAKDAAFAWQGHRQYSEWRQLNSVLSGGAADHGRWLAEVHGLFGIAAELVLVAIEAEVEKAILKSAIADESRSLTRAAMARSLRFFADGQTNYLIMAGHTFANITVRSLALHPAFDVASVASNLRLEPRHFQPFATHRRAWTSLNRSTALAMLKATQSLHAIEMENCARELVVLAETPSWTNLWASRNEQYHRWRFESPGVTGINFGNAMVDRLSRGEVVGFGVELLPEYTGGSSIVETLVEQSRECLEEFAVWMPTYLEAWNALFGALSKADASVADGGCP